MWELDHKEGWVPKNWCFQPVVLKTLESPLYYKEIKPDNSKWYQWILIGRTDVEVVASVLWPPALKSRVTRKDPDAGKDWRQEQKGAPEDDTVRWHPWFNRHEFEQAPGDGEWQGNLVCCSPWGCKESDTTEWLNINSSILQHCLFVFSMVLFGGNFVFWLISDLWKSYISCIRNSSHKLFPDSLTLYISVHLLYYSLCVYRNRYMYIVCIYRQNTILEFKTL